eukprot:363681-Chlamydomonas_euryale.AAC.7
MAWRITGRDDALVIRRLRTCDRVPTPKRDVYEPNLRERPSKEQYILGNLAEESERRSRYGHN